LGGLDVGDIAPDYPSTFAYLFEWWGELSACRPVGFGGPGAISYLEIEAWARLTDRAPSPYEVALIRALDNIFLKVLSEKNA
jgi:hypothetical protein